MHNFKWIYEHALARKGSIEKLESLLPVPKTASQLIAVSDDRYLSDMCRRVFRAGLKHSMVDAKWPAFEQVFFGFDPKKIILMSDDMLEQTMQDKRIIRHWGKIKSVRSNAFMIDQITQQHKSFGQFLADWPSNDIVGLWQYLAKYGAHLGGNSAPAFLRMVGKDTFLLSNDNLAALKAQGIIDKKPTGKRALNDVQDVFNRWHAESHRPYCQISRLLSFCAD